jgi:hypothetical protein
MVDNRMRCRAFQTTECVGDGISLCYNESCCLRNECWASVMIDDDFSLTCQLQAHYAEIRHQVELEDATTNTMVSITWPSKEYKNE